jgi:deazaflavin-dependent oxidoreductase (nitroreductase family)
MDDLQLRNLNMTDPIKQASIDGWIADHRKQYQNDPAAGHMWDAKRPGSTGPVPTLLLTTRGRQTGNESIMPLIYGQNGGDYVVIASKGGAPKHPGWYHNLVAQSEVTVQVVDDIFQARTRVAKDEERAGIWNTMIKIYPPYADYQEKTEREIPVVILEKIT